MSMDALRRTIALFAVATLAAVTLSACASIPRSGNVQQGGAVLPADNTAVEFFPAGPAADASPEQILRGFLEAATGPQNDYATARSFLAADFQSKWDPNLSVTVDDGSRRIVVGPNSAAGTSAQLTIAATASVDAMGQFTSIPTASTLSLSYSFVQQQGQWRISAAPQGVVIDRGIFEQVYTTHPVYFFDPAFRYLVPDVRWFARGASTTTRMVKAILAGPAPWLAAGGAVVSSFPPKSALVANSVPTVKQVALVDLTAASLPADGAGLVRMRQQLTASLQGVNNVSSVEILSDGAPLSQGGSAFVDSALPLPTDGRPFVVGDRGIGFVEADVIASTGLNPLLPTSGIQGITLAAGTRSAAYLTSAGVSLARIAIPTALLDSRTGLIAPSIDTANYVWSVPANAPSQLMAWGTDGRQYSIAVPWSEATVIRSLKLSHDGARLVAIVGTGSDMRLLVCSIARGENSIPIRLGPPLTLDAPSGALVDAAWVDATTIVSMSNGISGTNLLTTVIGGKSQTLTGFSQSNPVSIAGANTLSQVRVLLADGRLLALRNGTSWLSTANGIQVLGTQQ